MPLNYFESCGFYTYLYTVSVVFMLYLFCYVLRVRYSSESEAGKDDFDVETFIRRMTRATGLEVQEVRKTDTKFCRRSFSVRPMGRG